MTCAAQNTIVALIAIGAVATVFVLLAIVGVLLDRRQPRITPERAREVERVREQTMKNEALLFDLERRCRRWEGA